MSKLSGLFFSLSILFSATAAQAGFHLEPYVGHTVSGKWDSGTADDKFKAFNLGVKLGYQHISGFQIGGDIQGGSVNFDGFGVGGEDKATNAATGIYIGYQSPSGVRGYVQYHLVSLLQFDDVDNTTLGGDGFKLGVGYSFIDWLAVNLEYHMTSYDEFKNDIIDDYTKLNTKFKTNMFMVTVSFPFNFGGNN